MPKVSEFQPIIDYVAQIEGRKDKDAWGLGDKLLKHIPYSENGIHNDRNELIEACADAILKAGYEGYTKGYLVDIRWLSHEFDGSSRLVPWIKGADDVRPISWMALRAAGDRESFDKIYRSAKRGTKFTVDYMQAVKEAWWLKEKREHHKNWQKEIEKERDVKRHGGKTRRPRSKDYESDPPDETEMDVVTSYLKISADIIQAGVMLRDYQKQLESLIDNMPVEQQGDLVDIVVEVRNACQAILNTVPDKNRRSNLAAVAS